MKNQYIKKFSICNGDFYKLSLPILLLFLTDYSYCQTNEYSYNSSDSIALNTKYHGDLRELSSSLTGKFENDLDKARAIFRWIAENIAYDYKAVNHHKNIKVLNVKSGRIATMNALNLRTNNCTKQ